jgi:hypothetical protein
MSKSNSSLTGLPSFLSLTFSFAYNLKELMIGIIDIPRIKLSTAIFDLIGF